jgi:tRNA threonylcarbamoyladenosine biosynthesis protein TsaB
MDARMKESYCGLFEVASNGLVQSVGDEQVIAPDAIQYEATTIDFAAGTAWRAYPALRSRYPDLQVDDAALPRAREIAALAELEFQYGKGVAAADAQPVYLRNEVAWPQSGQPNSHNPIQAIQSNN